MTKNEKQLYKSGRKNPDGYRLKRKIFNNRITPVVLVLFILISFSVFILDKTDTVSLGEIYHKIGIIGGVDKQDSDFAVYYLDVGQSDCSIIVCDGMTMMIDTGTVNQLNTIREAMFSLNIDRLDYLVITHQHDDHMGSAAEIIRKYSVSNVIMPTLSKVNNVQSETYTDLINTILDNEVTIIPAQVGYKLYIGSSEIQLLSPVNQDENLNNMSIVLKVIYGENVFLFQGDSEAEVEAQLLKNSSMLKSDVLKLGHHGSNTSSGYDFLKAVDPMIAIASCGTDNTYNHPNYNVLERLEKQGICPYFTSLDGSVTVTSDGKSVTVYTENG